MTPFPQSSSSKPLPSELSLKERIGAEKCKRDLHEFVRQAWHVVEPSTPFKDGWHIQAITEHLEAATNGQIKDLLVNIPPRHAKSLLISTFWPMWVWIQHPEFKWLCASYALSLSIRDNRKCRMLIESDWFRSRWGSVFSLSSDQNAKIRFENSATGYRLAVSTESATTGEGGDGIICDDPISVRNANSVVKRDDCLLWYSTTISTRLNDPRKGIRVVVMQRVQDMDLSGYLLEQGGFEHLCLPAEYESDRKCTTSIGWQDPRTVDGELLWPEQVGPEQIAKLKRTLGPQAYAAQFQQLPAPGGGAIFKVEWFRYFSQEGRFYFLHTPAGEKKIPQASCWVFATVDLAASKKSTADYTVISTWAATPDNDLLLLEVERARLDGPEIEVALRRSYSRWNHTYMVIEQVAFQLTMLQIAAQAGIPVKPFKPQKDKVSRAISASTFYGNGQVYHMRFAEYLTDLEKELLIFPMGTHDDMVDTIAMATEILFDPAQPNIRSLDFDDTEAETLVAIMERGKAYEWGDV